MKSWVEFWDAEHKIYVDERHKRHHARRIAADITRHIPRPDAVVLDYGCGEALYAEVVSENCSRLLLCEAAPRVRTALAARVARHPRIEVLDPAAAAGLPPGSVDLIVANSLLQYLSRSELEDLIDVWRDKLRPDGRLVLADVIPPDVGKLTDARALLSFAREGGFLLPAIAGLARTALSGYGRMRQELGFATYAEEDIVALVAAHGLAAARVYPNFGHNQARMTFAASRTQ